MHSEKLQILEEVLGNFYQSNDEYLFSCPYCKHHKRKLSVNISKNTYKCWVCDSRGRNVYGLVRRFGNHSQKQHWRSFEETVEISEFDNIFEEKEIEETIQRIKLPSEYVCLANKNLPFTAKNALKYLKKRKITEYDILRWKIGYCESGEYRNRIIIPSFNLDGYCDYFVARTYTEDWLKYKNPPASKNVVFNELMIDWEKPVVLVEGIFDAINAENSIPLLGSTLSAHSRLFKALLTHSKRVYVALDKDAEKKALNIIKTLISHGVEVYKVDTPDHEDVGEMTKEEFEKRKQTASIFDFNLLLMQKILEA
jgi:DNA primase